MQVWHSKSFSSPSRDNGIIADFDVPVRLVGQSVHYTHHSDLSDGQRERLRTVAATMRADREEWELEGTLTVFAEWQS